MPIHNSSKLSSWEAEHNLPDNPDKSWELVFIDENDGVLEHTWFEMRNSLSIPMCRFHKDQTWLLHSLLRIHKKIIYSLIPCPPKPKTKPLLDSITTIPKFGDIPKSSVTPKLLDSTKPTIDICIDTIPGDPS